MFSCNEDDVEMFQVSTRGRASLCRVGCLIAVPYWGTVSRQRVGECVRRSEVERMSAEKNMYYMEKWEKQGWLEEAKYFVVADSDDRERQIKYLGSTRSCGRRLGLVC